MSRPRTPTEVLERRGAFRHDPQRKLDRAAEPVPDGELGDVPVHFDEALASIWTELAETCPPRVLTIADRFVVELAAQLLLKLRTGSAPGLNSKSVGMSGAEIAQLVGVLARLGMTPADRSRVGVTTNANDTQQTVDPWEQFSTEYEQ